MARSGRPWLLLVVLLDTDVEVAPDFLSHCASSTRVGEHSRPADVVVLSQHRAQRAQPAAPVSSPSRCAPSIAERLAVGEVQGSAAITVGTCFESLGSLASDASAWRHLVSTSSNDDGRAWVRVRCTGVCLLWEPVVRFPVRLVAIGSAAVAPAGEPLAEEGLARAVGVLVGGGDSVSCRTRCSLRSRLLSPGESGGR